MDTPQYKATILQYNPDTKQALVDFQFDDGTSDSKFITLPTTSQEEVQAALDGEAAKSKKNIDDATPPTPAYDPSPLVGQSVESSFEEEPIIKEE